MRTYQSRILPDSPAYRENCIENEKLLDRLKDALSSSRFQGAEKYVERARARGRMLASERLELLLDQDSPFLELLPLAGLDQEGGFGPGGTLIAGVGLVSDKICMVVSNVGTLKGGAIDYPTVQKHIRLAEIADENKLPVIYLVESAGVNLPDQEKIFNACGTLFRSITKRSKRGIPTISVVFGNSTAGGAYIPGMSDYAIFVKDQAKVFLAGPPLVKMATNEVADEESLGGAEMHSRVSGVADYLARTEEEALGMARDVIEFVKVPNDASFVKHEPKEPVLDINELSGIVPTDIKKPFEAREVIARLVDGSEFSEFKPEYGKTLVTAFARIMGMEVGILANNGVLFSDSANKGAQFIQLCNQNRFPLVFLQNITGFMVGQKYETEGIIKHGAKLINAVSNSEVPAITIMMGASYGAGNYAMNGRMYKPRFLFSWPNSRISVMGGEQLTGVMEIIQREAARKSGKEFDEEAALKRKQAMMDDVERKSTAFHSSSHLWDDGVIKPADTRIYLGMCLELIYRSGVESAQDYGVFRM
ncbi:acetyl-CoA carboxylase carboxyltransferase subunit [Fulvitalea axinellae]|uniref:Acetyl-CoA carboxylase carboxyltransferase subunit n=1 Tax=Fulvitalea axinellae TaxID=1182444 RepID=A0AAU9CEJ4_9BACT|nr:acetyl-CoA carboxylase carboxyltransferase subunit [Fulvitalea axinellae]